MRSLLAFENTARPEEELLKGLPWHWAELRHSRWDRQSKCDIRHAARFNRRLPLLFLLEPTQLLQRLIQGSMLDQLLNEETE